MKVRILRHYCTETLTKQGTYPNMGTLRGITFNQLKFRSVRFDVFTGKKHLCDDVALSFLASITASLSEGSTNAPNRLPNPYLFLAASLVAPGHDTLLRRTRDLQRGRVIHKQNRRLVFPNWFSKNGTHRRRPGQPLSAFMGPVFLSVGIWDSCIHIYTNFLFEKVLSEHINDHHIKK